MYFHVQSFSSAYFLVSIQLHTLPFQRSGSRPPPPQHYNSAHWIYTSATEIPTTVSIRSSPKSFRNWLGWLGFASVFELWYPRRHHIALLDISEGHYLTGPIYIIKFESHFKGFQMWRRGGELNLSLSRAFIGPYSFGKSIKDKNIGIGSTWSSTSIEYGKTSQNVYNRYLIIPLQNTINIR
jgi:hypothetical protein